MLLDRGLLVREGNVYRPTGPVETLLGNLRGELDGVERHFKNAGALFREIAVPFYLAVTELEHGEWLAGAGRGDEADPLLAEAREILERLEATPWLARVERVAGAAVEAAAR